MTLPSSNRESDFELILMYSVWTYVCGPGDPHVEGCTGSPRLRLPQMAGTVSAVSNFGLAGMVDKSAFTVTKVR